MFTSISASASLQYTSCTEPLKNNVNTNNMKPHFEYRGIYFRIGQGNPASTMRSSLKEIHIGLMHFNCPAFCEMEIAGQTHDLWEAQPNRKPGYKR